MGTVRARGIFFETVSGSRPCSLTRILCCKALCEYWRHAATNRKWSRRCAIVLKAPMGLVIRVNGAESDTENGVENEQRLRPKKLGR